MTISTSLKLVAVAATIACSAAHAQSAGASANTPIASSGTGMNLMAPAVPSTPSLSAPALSAKPALGGVTAGASTIRDRVRDVASNVQAPANPLGGAALGNPQVGLTASPNGVSASVVPR